MFCYTFSSRIRQLKTHGELFQLYQKKDIEAYYADATVSGSGVEKYDWESPIMMAGNFPLVTEQT